jgi:Na+/phosphate symporter
MVAALNVVRNAKFGFGLAALLTAAIVTLFVVLPGTTRPAYLYVALAFVLTVSLGGLLTALFTAVSAVRLARSSP